MPDLTPPPGARIDIDKGRLTVPDNPVIPFIRGDGTGPDIWAACVRVFDAAVEKNLRRNQKDFVVRSVRRPSPANASRMISRG